MAIKQREMCSMLVVVQISHLRYHIFNGTDEPVCRAEVETQM